MWRVLASCAVVGALACCGANADQVEFASATGTASDVGICDCIYRDMSQGDEPSVQIECDSLGGPLFGIAMFLDPRQPDVDQGVQLLVTPENGSSDAGGATGRLGALGPERRAHAGKDKIVRSLSGIEISWPDQDVCDAARGCDSERYHLGAGALHGGAGGCEDFWSTIDQYISN